MSWITKYLAATVAVALTLFFRVHQWVIAWFSTLLIALLDELPPELVVQYDLFGSYLDHANYWLPIEEGILITIVFIEYLLQFVLIRFLLKLLPTIW